MIAAMKADFRNSRACLLQSQKEFPRDRLVNELLMMTCKFYNRRTLLNGNSPGINICTFMELSGCSEYDAVFLYLTKVLVLSII